MIPLRMQTLQLKLHMQTVIRSDANCMQYELCWLLNHWCRHYVTVI